MNARTLKLTLAPLIAATALLAAGCGSQAPTPSLPSDGASPSTSSQAPTPADPDDAPLALAKCLRDQGLDVPDPGPDGMVDLSGAEQGDALNSALAACEKETGAMSGAVDGPGDQESIDAALGLARCMREKGHEFADPAADGSFELPAPPEGDAGVAWESDLMACAAQLSSEDASRG